MPRSSTRPYSSEAPRWAQWSWIRPDVAALVLEEHQVLAQHADELGRALVGQLLGDADREPVAAEQLAAGVPGPTRAR